MEMIEKLAAGQDMDESWLGPAPGALQMPDDASKDERRGT